MGLKFQSVILILRSSIWWTEWFWWGFSTYNFLTILPSITWITSFRCNRGSNSFSCPGGHLSILNFVNYFRFIKGEIYQQVLLSKMNMVKPNNFRILEVKLSKLQWFRIESLNYLLQDWQSCNWHLYDSEFSQTKLTIFLPFVAGASAV